jgi:ribosome-binding protein aMBF1 (putative translation factor)
VTPEQSIEARRLLGWSQLRLALAADLSPFAVELFEACSPTTTPEVISAIERALQAAGVQFVANDDGGAGVRLRGRDQ